MLSAVELKHEVGAEIDIVAQSLSARPPIESEVRDEVLRILEIVRTEVEGTTSASYLRALGSVVRFVVDETAGGRYDA
ncbi:hypothetical protein DES52_11849 [Deinococcus yavapaiensis KR-236]|uniref:Uncharacterized protein n=1 Tax=Deinococcus yavapaiensis KR-236 TaxID=694435 RepID=A0A318SHF1_9DEIO|nr:hypothetical protein DES52_11849 [Deinococcus yavapaiensis KR-236]